MRVRVACAGVFASALAAMCAAHAPTARAAETLSVSVGGSVNASWHGDPARGCAAAGLCGVTGALSIANPEPADGFSGASGESGPVQPEVINLGGARTVRVVRVNGGASVGACVASSFYTPSGLVVTPVSGGVQVSDVATDWPDPFGFGPTLPGAGDCAGPTAAEISAAVPSATASDARLRAGVVLDLDATRPLASGPLTGDVRSALRITLRLKRVPGTSPGLAAPARAAQAPTTVRSYSISTGTGALRATFAGAPPPACVPLDACGVSGASTISALQGTIEIQSGDELDEDSTASGTEAVFAPGASATATVSEVAARAGGPTCSDGRSVVVPLTLTAPTPRSPQLTLRVAPYSALGDDDPLRTHCEGPGEADLFAGDGGDAILAQLAASPTESLASGTVPAAQLKAGGPVTVPLTADVSAATGPYGMVLSGALSVVLRPTGPAHVLMGPEVAG